MASTLFKRGDQADKYQYEYTLKVPISVLVRPVSKGGGPVRPVH